ncbi:unnamed protein product [Danaus chrysippus]|uniref:(African queen) hypothetical protein n=1 Tax=Danaus chrysippus TaxID=151541 RepID=A0A8J2VW77_9NEOP|nr:unnamed protein product [Danaus chrysippus]
MVLSISNCVRVAFVSICLTLWLLFTDDISSDPVILYDVLDYSKPESSSYFQHNEPMLTFDYLAAVSEALHLMYRRRLRGIVDHRMIYCNHFFLALRMGWISICR